MITPIWEVNKYGWLRESQFNFHWETEKGLDMNNEWPITGDYDSHRPLLYYAATRPDVEYIVEFGVGHGSTPMLQSLEVVCESLETDKEWADKFDGVILVKSYDYNLIFSPDVLFIDGKPGEERKDLIARYADFAEVIVVHDTEPGAEYVYGMDSILRTFKYRYDYKPEGKPWTTAVSNIIDVSKWNLDV